MPHFAITIGPIYRTFQQVRKTRELWAASWLFSHISKRLIEEINSLDSKAVYVPYYQSDTPPGIGLYPDRIFLKSDTISIATIEEIKNKVYAEVAKIVDAAEGNSNSAEFLKTYFRIYIVQYTIQEGDNPIVLGNQLLDTSELRDTWQLQEQPNQLLRFFRQVNKLKVDSKKWIDDNLKETDIRDQTRFESMIEIATRPIRDVDKAKYKQLVKDHCYTDAEVEVDEHEDPFVAELKNALNKKDKPEIFKNYHKYVCVLKADGDRVGKYIKAITENVEVELAEVSKNLYEWGKETHKLIKEKYFGATIYVGGDDVLALLPVVGKNGWNIIKLCEEINNDFQKRFIKELKDENGKPIKPTLSFGVSVTYYKFPLNEALKKADDLLYKAKETRNTLCLSLLKHSGSTFDIALSFDANNDVRKAFNELLPCFAKEENYVSSLIHHLREHEPVYRTISSNPVRVSNYLKFNFDEEKLEKPVQHTAALIAAQQVKHAVRTNDAKSSRAAMEETYSVLRMIKFLNGHDDGK